MDKIFFINGEEVKVQKYSLKEGRLSFELRGKSYSYENLEFRDELLIQGASRFAAHISKVKDGEQMVLANGLEAKLSSGRRTSKAKVSGSLNSPMPGKIFKIIKDIGDEVKTGEVILILEAMKMEHSIRADKDGVVKNIFFGIGELVQGGTVLASVE